MDREQNGVVVVDGVGAADVWGADGVAAMAIRALAEAPDGAVWCGADDGTLYRCEPDHLQAFHANDALAGRRSGRCWRMRTG